MVNDSIGFTAWRKRRSSCLFSVLEPGALRHSVGNTPRLQLQFVAPKCFGVDERSREFVARIPNASLTTSARLAAKDYTCAHHVAENGIQPAGGRDFYLFEVGNAE
jgi:hypothetical protein